MRGKKGEKWGNDKKIKFVRIRMTSCREATAMPRSDRRAAAVNDNARSVAAPTLRAKPCCAAPRCTALVCYLRSPKYPVRYEITPSVPRLSPRSLHRS